MTKPPAVRAHVVQDTPTSRPRFVCDGLLGTVVEITVPGAESSASGVAEAVFDEVRRLERVFNWFDGDSELRRWSRGEAAPGEELATVVALAEYWKMRSGGAFDPAAGELVTLWQNAENDGRVPRTSEIAVTMAAMATSVHRHNLNAIAKGWIVDRAVEHVVAEGAVHSLIVNAGGDLLHLDTDPIIVGIEDPRRPHDNVPPLLRVAVDNAALATSGGSRRGWIINGARYSHIVDPRTGWPQRQIASASVIAGDVATADVVATVLTVLEVDQGLALGKELGVGCCIIDTAGIVHRNERWQQAERTAAFVDSGASQRLLRLR